MNDESQRLAEASIPTRIVVESKSFERLLKLIESPPEPTESLRQLMHGGRFEIPQPGFSSAGGTGGWGSNE